MAIRSWGHLIEVKGTCRRCGGQMGDFIDGDDSCVNCGWVRYRIPPIHIEPERPKKVGRPFGYTRSGKVRMN